MNVHKSSRRLPLIVVSFLIKLELSRQIFENFLIPNCMKIRPVEAALFFAGGRVDRHDETNGRFSYFAIAPKKQYYREDACKGSLQAVNTTIKSVLTRYVTVWLDVSVAVVVGPGCGHRSLLLLLLVAVMHGDNHQSTLLRSIRTHVCTFHLHNVSEHRRTRTVHRLDVNLHKSPTAITTTRIHHNVLKLVYLSAYYEGRSEINASYLFPWKLH